MKGRERDSRSRSRGLSKRGRGSSAEDKPPIFTVVDRCSDQQKVMPAKSAGESAVRLLLGDREAESLTVYTDGFRAYDPLEDDDNLQREAVFTAMANTSMETHT
jgi:transposase-like protein